MALVLGTNSGFVTVAPTADPNGTGAVIDGKAIVTKHTSPANSVRITEIGWYRSGGSGADANFEVGLYAADGAVVPGEAGTRLYVDATNATGTTDGWKSVSVDWAISSSTDYWLGLQVDSHSLFSYVDFSSPGGAGYDDKATQTSLPDPFGSGAIFQSTGMGSIYAVVEINTPSNTTNFFQFI